MRILKMTAEQRYNQAKKDYYKLIKLNDGNYPYDMTGGFEDGKAFEALMNNPTKEKAASYYEMLIEYSAGSGFENRWNDRANRPKLENKEVMAIYKKYDCLGQLSRWQ